MGDEREIEDQHVEGEGTWTTKTPKGEDLEMNLRTSFTLVDGR